MLLAGWAFYLGVLLPARVVYQLQGRHNCSTIQNRKLNFLALC